MAENGEDYPGIEAETSFEVRLYIYDLSKELSKSFKKILKGKPLPGIWHTALVAYGREYYFASSGVESCRPGETILGEPDQILTLGKTELPYSVFLEYIFALGESTYKPGSYHLLEHNCNTFSQEVSSFLTGGPIPEELRELPPEILSNKTLSCTLKEYFDKLNLRVEGSKGISFGQPCRKDSVDQATVSENVNGDVVQNGQNPTSSSSKSSKNKSQQHSSKSSGDKGQSNNVDHPSPKKSSKMPVVNGSSKPPKDAPKSSEGASEGDKPPDSNVHHNVEPPVEAAQPPPQSSEAASDQPSSRALETDDGGDDTPLPTFTSRRSRKYQEPPITYPDIDGVVCYNKIMELVGDKLNLEEKQSMEEILEYLKCPEGGAWALGAPHLDALGRLLNDRNLPEIVPVLALQVLQASALKEDVILLLHQDRDHHHIMSYLFRIENLPHEEQEQITTFMCNLCHHASSFDWLMYISEWLEDGQSCNNSRVTIRVAVHSLLCDRPHMVDRGSALIYNLALKELFDDTATELAMALLQFLQGELSEEHAFRCLTALLRFMCISYNDVPALMKMLGPDVKKFKRMSERIDRIVEEIEMKQNVRIPSS